MVVTGIHNIQNRHTSNVQPKQVIFRNIYAWKYTYTYATKINEKEMKELEFMGGSGGRKEKGEMIETSKIEVIKT